MWNARVAGKVAANIWARSRLGEITRDVSSDCECDARSIYRLDCLLAYRLRQLSNARSAIFERNEREFRHRLDVGRVVRSNDFRSHKHDQLGLGLTNVLA